MTWVVFGDEAAFTAWHDDLCVDLAIPRPGYNQQSGAVAILFQWTTAQYEPMLIDGQVVLDIPEDVILADPVLANLDVMQPGPIPFDPSPVEFAWAKQLPETYTVDGVTYDVETGEVIP